MLLVNPVARVILDRSVNPFPVAPPLKWVDEPAGYQPGWTYDGKNFIPSIPVPVPVSDGRAEAYAAARAAVVDRIIQTELAKPTSEIQEIKTLRTALGGR